MQRSIKESVELPAGRARRLLARAAPLLRLLGSPDRAPELLSDGSGLHCVELGQQLRARGYGAYD